MNKYILIGIIVLVVALVGGYQYGSYQRDLGYKAGWTAAIKSTASVPAVPERPDTVQAQTAVVTQTETVVRPKTASDKASVVITTEKPVVTATVNGKTYDFKPQTEVLQTGVKTYGTVNIRIPERRWVVGLGTDGRRAAYMLKAPIGKSAVGLWVAGSGREKVMGGLSVSF